jgi:restriction system protein
MSLPPNSQRLTLDRSQRDRFGRIRTLDQLKSMHPVDFEKFCGWLWERRGYTTWLSPASGDAGIDLWMARGEERVVVQCKRYDGTVGQPVVRDLYGTMIHNKANRAMLMTTGTVSRHAEEWATGKPIHLMDGHELISMVRQERLGGSADPGAGWFARNGRRLGLVLLLLLGLVACLAAIFLAADTFRARTGQATPVPVPTSAAVVSATAAPTSGPTAIPTPTLRPTLTPTPEFGQPLADFTIPRLREAPPLTTDPAAWEGVPAIVTTHITLHADGREKPEELRSVWQLGYDPLWLYGLVTVRDDRHVQSQVPRYGYRGDSLELEIDTTAARAGRATGSDYQYILSPGNFSTLEPGAFRFQGGENGAMADFFGTHAEVVAEKSADGYLIAFRIPWYDIGMRRPAPGTPLGMALSVNDNDTPGSVEQTFALSNVPGRQWSRPDTWGRVILGE